MKNTTMAVSSVQAVSALIFKSAALGPAGAAAGAGSDPIGGLAGWADALETNTNKSTRITNQCPRAQARRIAITMDSSA
jgi:hypothetical protein